MLKAHDSSVVHEEDTTISKSNDSTTSTILPDDTAFVAVVGGHTATPSTGENNVVSPQQQRRDALFRWVPIWMKFHDAPMEATGISIDMYGRGHVLMSSMFLGPALLGLAKQAAASASGVPLAACDDSAAAGTATAVCKIYGFRPSSILSNIAICSGIFGSLSMPVMGAVVDHTPYRRQVATVSALALSLVKGLEIGVGPATWPFIAAMQVVSYVLYDMHAVAAYAYTFELSSDPTEQSQYNSFYNVVIYISMLVFLIQVFGTSVVLGMGDDDVQTAQISQVYTTIISLACFGFAWNCFFRNRPVVSRVPSGQSLWTCGFTKVRHTSERIMRDYRSLMWATLAIMFGEAGAAGFSTIATTFLKEVLHMSANEIALIFLVVLLVGVPGSFCGGYMTKRLQSPVRSVMLCHVLFIATTGVAPLMLRGPDDKDIAFLLATLWGTLLGWLSPVDVTIFMNLMPGDSQTEFMGIFSLATDILSFLPALVFSVLNESGFRMAWGLVSLNLFFGAALVCFSQIGDFEQARRQATTTTTTNTTSNTTSFNDNDDESGGLNHATSHVLNDNRDKNDSMMIPMNTNYLPVDSLGQEEED